MSRPIVLVHGAWHGAWCWDSVMGILDAAGRRSVAVDLPSVSSPTATLQNDATCVREMLDTLDGDVVLVGHSYGGAVVTEAGAHPGVAHLVYLTAFALEAGESLVQNTLTGGQVGSDLEAAMQVGDGVMTLDSTIAAAAFFNDCAPEQTAGAIKRLRPQSLAALQGRTTVAAWREKPATYVVCTEDCALPVALQRSNAARIGNSVEWPTGHSPFLSRPDLVAELLIALSSS